MSAWLPYALMLALVLWMTRHKWQRFLPKFDIGTPPHQPSQRFQDYAENKKRHEEQQEVDRILERIAQKGMKSLSAKERHILEKASQRQKQQQQQLPR